MNTRLAIGGELQQISEDEVAGIAISGGIKRDGCEWEPAGIDLTQYKRNPVILRDHDPLLVIGAATGIGLTPDGNAIGIRVKFAPPGTSAVADEARALAKAGFLRAFSGGINPIATEPLDPKDPWGGLRITEAELLEVSLVAVGADSDALVTARSFMAKPGAAAMLRSLPPVSPIAVRSVLGRVRGADSSRRPPTPAEYLEQRKRHANAVFGLQRASRDQERADQEARRRRVAELERGS